MLVRLLAALGACAVLLLALPAEASTQVGVAAAVRGSVRVVRGSAIGSVIQSGAKLFLGDEIATGPSAGLQILLLDETVFTLGPDSRMKIDAFVYDPASSDGKLDARLVRGASRFVSGRVARKHPRSMNVELPAGTIGIRGTIVYAKVDAEQGTSTVVLAGPGEGNTTGAAAGAIEVSNAGVAREVVRSGWGVEVPGFGQPPSEAFPVPADFYDGLRFDAVPVADATPAADGDGDTAKSAAAAPAGDSAAGDADPVPASSPLAEAGGHLDAASLAADSGQILLDSVTNAELPLPDPVLPEMTSPLAPVITPTLISELTNLAGTFTGHYFYDVLDAPLASGGSYDLLIDLDFTNQVVGVQLLDVVSPPLELSGPGSGATSVPFTSAQGVEASYDLAFPYVSSPVCFGSDCQADVKLRFENSDSTTAAIVSGDVRVSYSISLPPITVEDTGEISDVPITSIVP
jgi:hypothetical protein